MIAVLGWTALSLSRQSVPPIGPTLRASLAIPDQLQPLDFEIAPDGRALAYMRRSATEMLREIVVRDLASSAVTVLPDSIQGEMPFWSSDGRAVGFLAGGKLRTVALDGGARRVLGDQALAGGAAWGPDGTIIVAGADGIFRVVASGARVRLTTVDRAQHERAHLWPRFLPDGRRFLFSVQGEAGDLEAVDVGSTDGTPPRKVIDAAAAQYVNDHLLLVRDGKLFTQRCDLRTLALTGKPTLLAEQVAVGGAVTRQVAVSASRNGVVVFRAFDPSSRVYLVEYDREGRTLRELSDPGRYSNPSLSPDGTRLLIGRVDQQRANIVMAHLQRDTMTRLTFGAEDHDPVWSPDGKRMIYASNANGKFGLFEKDISGGGDAVPLLQSDVMVYPNDWSPDGRTLIYTRLDPQTLRDLWTLSLPGRTSTLWLQTPTTDDMATFSPDGRWVAYVSGDSGRGEVYVRSLEGAGPVQIIEVSAKQRHAIPSRHEMPAGHRQLGGQTFG